MPVYSGPTSWKSFLWHLGVIVLVSGASLAIYYHLQMPTTLESLSFSTWSVCSVNITAATSNELDKEAYCSSVTEDRILPVQDSRADMKNNRVRYGSKTLFVCEPLSKNEVLTNRWVLVFCMKVEQEYAEPPIAGHMIPATYYRLVEE